MRRFGILGLTLALGVSAMAVGAQAQSMRTRHVREAVANGEASPVGRLASSQIMNLNIVLPLADQAGLDTFLSAVYDPSSSTFHKFLTPAEFTAKFGPTQSQYDAVVQFAVTHGFTVTGGSRDAMDVQVRGPVSAVESAFHVHMGTYRHPTEDREFYAPDSEPTTDLPFELWHVSGLDNY
jgi:subtilase family serine protease